MQINRTLKPVEGDVLPAIGAKVLIHLGSLDKWVEHTVAGFYAWPDLAKEPGLHRVFVRVVDAEGTENARLLSDVKPAEGHSWSQPAAPAAVAVNWKSVANMMESASLASAMGMIAGTSNWAAFMCKTMEQKSIHSSPFESMGPASVDWEAIEQRLAAANKQIHDVMRDVATQAGRSQFPAQAPGMAELAAFGALVLDAHRNPDPADVDGGTLQDLATRASVLQERQVSEPCGESCTCAEVGAIPGTCYFVPQAVGEVANHLTEVLGAPQGA